MKLPFDRYFVSQRTKPVVGVDIGASCIKFAEIELTDDKPKLLNFGSIPTPDGAFGGSSISKPDAISEAIVKLFKSHQVETTRVAFSLPSSSVFTKRISMSKTAANNFEDNIEFEASNYIPHRIDAVNLDYQVLSPDDSDAKSSTVDVLLVAVKQEFLSPYLKLFSDIDLEPVIADVESFAICNAFEHSSMSSTIKTPTAIIDIGNRHTTITLMKNGKFLLSGEVNVGSRNYITALIDNLKVSNDQANLLVSGVKIPEVDDVLVQETIDRVTDYVGGEVHRQTGFFWSGAGVTQDFEQVLFSGGGARIPGLVADLKSRFDKKCDFLNIGEFMDVSTEIDKKHFDELSLSLNVALGLALRRSSDKFVN